MCGIAGFHIAPELATTMLADERDRALLIQGLQSNSHRGKDATGFFSVGADGSTTVEKLNVDSKEFIDEYLPLVNLGNANIVGVHTRASTKGKPENNENNHPVVWGNVAVTHNGHINNDDAIKNAVDYKEKPRPEVDSAAIAAVLNDVAKNPELEFKAILKGLSHLRGGFAIHAVWANHPGYSLFAKGSASPLHFFHDREGIFLYSSEAAGVKELQKVLGLEGSIRSFDDRAVLLLRDGIPVAWGVMDDPNESDTVVRRMNPGGVEWVRTNRANYFAAGNRPWNIAGDDNGPRLVLDHGHETKHALSIDFKDFAGSALLTPKMILPVPATQPFAAIAEADSVYRFSYDSGQDDCMSVWFGEVELIVDDQGRLLDVYNWNNAYDRFAFDPVEHKDNTLSFDEWITRKTTYAAATTYARHQLPFQKADGGKGTLSLPAPKHRRKRDDGLPDALFENKGFMTLQEVGLMSRCKRDNSMPLLRNERCPTHGQWAINHVDPHNCEFMQIAALAALNRSLTITTMLGMTMGKMVCGQTAHGLVCKDGVHHWVPDKTAEIPIRDGKLIKVHLPLQDRCTNCTAKRWVSKFIPAVENYLKEKNLHVTV